MCQRQNIWLAKIEHLKLLAPEEYSDIEKNPEAQTGEQVAHPHAGAWDMRQAVTHGNPSRRASIPSTLESMLME
jgi:hypothetical protein